MTSGNENERVGFYGRLRTFRGGQMVINGKAITIAPLSDLSGTNLRGADLRGADLRGANLYEANLSGADLREADLRGANLALAILPDGFLQGE